MTKLEFPKVDMYFIAWNNNRVEIQAYGVILTTQVMETLLTEVDYYENKNNYNAVLTNNGIDVPVNNTQL
jgi:hypothetical protein